MPFVRTQLVGLSSIGKPGVPLAFVNIIINGDEQKGTISDVHGRFAYNGREEIVLITCSYVGYEKLNISFQEGEEKTNLSISMQPSAYHFGEVIVRAGENPANRIIRKAIENKPINNPEEIASFRYTSYNKVLYDFVYSNASEADSLTDLFSKVFKGGHVLIMESVADRKFIQPDISEEVIRGVKVSGFKHPSFAPLATDLQPFSFYREIIPIFDMSYINPISQGSLGKYHFTLEDTIFQSMDTTFIISYKPLPGKNFAGLKGLLYINTNTYAIQNVIASPADEGLIAIKIQQQYEYLNAEQWFPAELNFELTMYPNGLENVGISANGVSYIDEVELLPDLRKRDFALEAVRMDELAAVQDTFFWNAHRKEPLSEQERTTYEVVDSLGAKYKFDAILGIAEKLSRDRIGIGWLDIDVSKTLVLNEFEGLRLGFGAYTNEKLFKHLSIGGFFGYGLKDHQWKYGGEFIWTLDKQNEIVINGEYQNTLVEAGKNNLRFFDKRQYDFRSWLANQMDRIERSRVAFGFRAFRYAKFNIAFRHTTTTPQYAYQYAPLGEEGDANL